MAPWQKDLDIFSVIRGEKSSDQHPGHLLYVGDEILPSYIEITINHDKDPY